MEMYKHTSILKTACHFRSRQNNRYGKNMLTVEYSAFFTWQWNNSKNWKSAFCG